MRLNLLKLFLAAASIFLLSHVAEARRHDPYQQDYLPYHTFYPSPLDGRVKILAAPAGNNFNFEIGKLVDTPATHFIAVEGTDYHNRASNTNDEEAREKFNRENLSTAQIVALNTAKMAASSDAAYEDAKTLPPALRAYTAGSVAFRQADFQTAQIRFSDALTASDSQPAYKVWATFMLGRTYAKLNFPDKARTMFAATREMVTSGIPDPLGLAAASYGEEARLALDEAGGVLGEEKFNSDQPKRLQQFHAAIRLYTLQAKTGSQNGLDSLHILAKDIKNVPTDFTLLMQDELSRRLFLAYIRGYNGPLAGVEQRKQFLATLLPLFPAEDKDIADRLAASAEEIDKRALVQRYTSQKRSALSIWVQAKVAVHEHDLEKAATLYEEAFYQQNKETDNPSVDPDNEMLAHERAVLTLARGFYLQSFEEFFAQKNDEGAADFMARRILTVDELKQFIDKNAPESVTTEDKSSTASKSDKERQWQKINNARGLRTILGLRLMRVGKNNEAQAYFEAEQKSLVIEYNKWLDTANSTSNKIVKAKALYSAATLMKDQGYSLLGNELIDLETSDADLTNNSFVTPGERARLANSRSETALPPSFRRIAVTQAMQAADLLPPKTQAFAAILCQATHWIRPVSQEDSTNIYHRYVQQGAMVPWATHFGEHCPEPHFSTIKYRALIQRYVTAGHRISRHPVMAATIMGASLLFGIGILIHRVRKRKFGRK